MAAQRHVGEPEVVQGDDDVVEKRVDAPVGERLLEIAQRLAEVAANAGHGAQIRGDVDLESRIRRARPATEGFLEELFGVIEVALTPADSGEDVEGMTQRVTFVAQLRCGNGGDRDVFRRAIVGVHLIGARNPAQQHGRQRRRRCRQGAQRALVLLARLCPAAELVECACFLDEGIERRVLVRWFDEPEVRVPYPGAGVSHRSIRVLVLAACRLRHGRRPAGHPSRGVAIRRVVPRQSERRPGSAH